ncbi:MAG: methyltransferase, TrmH family [Chloroflexota bacterium]|nr:methyltransferase, TrmH family [Chloroflexota bacterium]
MMTPMPSPLPAVLTSSANPRVKAAVALRERRARDRTGLTLIDGSREIRRALDAGIEVVEAFSCEPLLAGADARVALDHLRARGASVQPVSESVFARLAFGERAAGLVAVVRIPSTELADLTLPAEPLIAVIERLEKPGNIGAVLRSADAAAVDAVVASSPRTDLFNPNAIRASAGTMFSVPIAAAPTAEVLAWLHERGVRILAARVDAERLYTDADLTGPLALVLGGEADGLTGPWAADAIEAVRLPMLGVADSLNVSVSAAILFYEAKRQRGLPIPARKE